MCGLLRGARDDERLRIGETDVLTGQDHDAARDEHRILTRVDHAHEPVERGIGIGPAHALDERRDRVVVLVAGPVIEERPPLQRIFDLVQADGLLSVRSGHCRVGGELERVERDTGVAVAHRDEAFLGLLRQSDRAPKAAVFGERAFHDDPHLLLGERLQREDPGSRQKGGVHLERRVLRRRSEQGDVAVLDVREHDVLLRLVEAVDLIDEEDGALVRKAAELPRLLDDLSQLAHPGRHRRDRHEPGVRALCTDRGEGRLPRAGWAPQDHRRQLAGVHRFAKHAALSHQVLLPDEFVEVAWPHPRGKGLGGRHRPIVPLRPNRRSARYKQSLMLRSDMERGAILSQSSLRELRSYYRALGDVNRLRIVQILVTEGEQPVSELARRLRISQPLMSWHLRRLRRAGIIRTERVGREVRCSFDREKFAELHARGFRLLMNRAEAQA